MRLGATMPAGPILLDTNVFINALAGRGPAILRDLLAKLPRLFVSGPTRAELSWVKGRLDPQHPGTSRVLEAYAGVVGRIDPAKVLVPGYADWLEAGELAGRLARSLAGGGRHIGTVFDRVELISDALTAVVAARAGLNVLTEDRHFTALADLVPGLRVVLYDRVPI